MNFSACCNVSSSEAPSNGGVRPFRERERNQSSVKKKAIKTLFVNAWDDERRGGETLSALSFLFLVFF